jgi:ABC-type transport system involved in multi-copper enzyme maturation permease subunit
MEATAPVTTARINRWLPYWAVFQSDLRQTLRSWVYRVWVLASILAAGGYLLYRIGIYHEAAMVQSAADLLGDLLHWTVVGSITLIIALTGGSISSERGTMADSVLSRGISRYQYFMGKWHARMLAVLSTFVAMVVIALVGSFFFLEGDLSLSGSLVALVTIVAMLAAVATLGVTISAMANSTMLAITVLWICLYGGGFAMYWLPARFLSPDRFLKGLPDILRGSYEWTAHGHLITWSAVCAVIASVVGLICFGRRDV